MRRIYLDYLATTPTDSRVASIVHRYMCESFGNASSIDHSFGDDAAEAVSRSRMIIGEAVGAKSKQVYFTSGATESLNLALQGIALSPRFRQQRLRILTTPVEHPAVLSTCAALARMGRAEVRMLQVDEYAGVDLNEIESLASDSDVIAVMAANNEVGTIYPVSEISEICSRLLKVHLCDATQAFGKVPLTVNELTILACSAHKIYGPKGVGALVLPNGLALEPLFFGGDQQHGVRPGTLNVPAIVGLGEAARLRTIEMTEDEERIALLRDRLESRLKLTVSDLSVNGDCRHRLAGCLSVSFLGVPADAIIARVRDRVAMSTGAACSSGAIGPSHVLVAMKLGDARIEGALRISLGKYTSVEDVDDAAEELERAVSLIRGVL